jgi:hypothetical protein
MSWQKGGGNRTGAPMFASAQLAEGKIGFTTCVRLIFLKGTGFSPYVLTAKKNRLQPLRAA